jgi:hypothetical protein
VRWLVLVFVVAWAARAIADPDRPLGMSSRGITRWNDPDLEVTPSYTLYKGHVWIAWDASVDGVPIDHARFYELVGRPDLERRKVVRRSLGVVAVVAGAAVSALGAHWFLDGRVAAGVPVVFAGALGAMTSTIFLVAEADTVSAAEAQQLVDNSRRFSLGLGGRF